MTSTRLGPIKVPQSLTNAATSFKETATEVLSDVVQEAQKAQLKKYLKETAIGMKDQAEALIEDPPDAVRALAKLPPVSGGVAVTEKATEVFSDAMEKAREAQFKKYLNETAVAVKDQTEALIEDTPDAARALAESPYAAVPIATAEFLHDTAVAIYEATCCPHVAPVKTYWQDGGPVTNPAENDVNLDYVDPTTTATPENFGFDNRTNMPAEADRGQNEYWNRVGGPGTPGDRRALDGAAWISVTTDNTAEIEVQFSNLGAFFIGNVEVEIDDVSKIRVSPTTFEHSSSRLTIEGLEQGECTIKFMCKGKPIGWCHVAVYEPFMARLTLRRINIQDKDGNNLTSAEEVTEAQAVSVQNILNHTYAQCGVEWFVNYAAPLTINSDSIVEVYNSTLKVNVKPGLAFFEELIEASNSYLGGSTYQAFYLEPLVFDPELAPSGYTESGGIANGIPGGEVSIYTTIDSDWGLELISHELGHSAGLHHPDTDYFYDEMIEQLPENFRLPMATINGVTENAMVSDHINMMGYGTRNFKLVSLRYEQWKTIRRNIIERLVSTAEELRLG